MPGDALDVFLTADDLAVMDDDSPIENKMISKSIENAQVKVEAFHFDMRKHLVDYDDVINTQRDIIYKLRKNSSSLGYLTVSVCISDSNFLFAAVIA